MFFLKKDAKYCWNCCDCISCEDRKSHPGCLNCNLHKKDKNLLRWLKNKIHLALEVDEIKNTPEDLTQECAIECAGQNGEDRPLCVKTEVESMPQWVWVYFGDGSGYLKSPIDSSFFLYDLSPYYNQGGIEFQINSTEKWDIFWGTLQEFKAFAEKEAKKIFSLKMLQPIPENLFTPEEPEWTGTEGEISWYIPVWFSVDDTFEGIHVNTDENPDWVNVYATHNIITKQTQLTLVYDSDSYCWDAKIEMDEVTKEMVCRIINEEADEFLASEVQALNISKEIYDISSFSGVLSLCQDLKLMFYKLNFIRDGFLSGEFADDARIQDIIAVARKSQEDLSKILKTNLALFGEKLVEIKQDPVLAPLLFLIDNFYSEGDSAFWRIAGYGKFWNEVALPEFIEGILDAQTDKLAAENANILSTNATLKGNCTAISYYDLSDYAIVFASREAAVDFSEKNPIDPSEFMTYSDGAWHCD